MTRPPFTVDTHLFRELGQLLVGRDSTALVELIKNSYDADATHVTVFGEALHDPERGFIKVVDDGNGMTPEQFRRGFLRIASRSKDEGTRRSPRYSRRFTGEKGIGRLAAHKLAIRLGVESIPWARDARQPRTGVSAAIDWDAVEQAETLEDVTEDAVEVHDEPITSHKVRSGTSITLTRIRRAWTAAERDRFFNEVQTFLPPDTLIEPFPADVSKKRLIFSTPNVREATTASSQFKVDLTGDFAGGESHWKALAAASHWLVEIRAQEGDENVHFVVAPTKRIEAENPVAERHEFTEPHPDPANGPFFDARIIIREGLLRLPAAEKRWAKAASGIRVFVEGFRVLPYGDVKNDWLSLDFDYTRRAGNLLGEGQVDAPASADRLSLVLLPNSNYYGAVFLTQQGGRSLRMLVNREGFVPEAGFDHLQRLVRLGIDLSTRIRAAASAPRREERRKRRSQKRTGGSGTSAPPEAPAGEAAQPLTSRQVFDDAVKAARELAAEARAAVAAADFQSAAANISAAAKELEDVSPLWDELISEGAMLRILASVGTQLAGFIHEVRGLLGTAEAVDAAIERIRKFPDMPRATLGDLGRVQRSVADLRRNLERQASYLLDVINPDTRRRRSRQSLADRFNTGARLVAHLAEKHAIGIHNKIPEDLRSPPMFPAELTTVFSNLLTNAVKAAGDGGRIRATARRIANGQTRLLIENTGAAVNLADAERWFRPFESTTVEVDPVLGQGMGLGLTITRSMLEEYGATVKFVAPSEGYSTAVEIIFPG